MEIFNDDPAEAALRYMSHALRSAPFHIRRILAANYHKFLSNYRLLQDEARQLQQTEATAVSPPEFEGKSKDARAAELTGECRDSGEK